MKIIFIVASFGCEEIAGAIAAIKNISQNLFDQKPSQILVVDNAGFADAEEQADYIYLSGDNTCFDFSAWDVGIKYLDANVMLDSNDVVILINDTIHRRAYAESGQRFYEEYEFSTGIPNDDVWAAGFVDDFPKSTNLFGFDISSWIRSNLVVLNVRALKTLGSLALDYPDNEIFHKSFNERF